MTQIGDYWIQGAALANATTTTDSTITVSWPPIYNPEPLEAYIQQSWGGKLYYKPTQVQRAVMEAFRLL